MSNTKCRKNSSPKLEWNVRSKRNAIMPGERSACWSRGAVGHLLMKVWAGLQIRKQLIDGFVGHGFHKMKVEARFVRTAAVFFRSPTSHRHERGGVESRVLPNPPGHFKSVHLRHADVQKNH